jgi:hypothetical protein
MGVFDTIVDYCPNCGEPVGLQTKICSSYEESLRELRSGDTLPLLEEWNYYGDMVPRSFIWKLKDVCHNCNTEFSVLVMNKRMGNLVANEVAHVNAFNLPIYDEGVKSRRLFG